MVESIETVITGAGQAGLSTSYFLQRAGREHLILEKARKPADSWRNQRWDSFTFVTANWFFQLPGGAYDGPEPDGFIPRDELVSRFERYAEKYQLPILLNTCVSSVEREDDRGSLVRTEKKEFRAHNVVAANGWFQVGKIPPFSQ